jgi:hypothetical protein
MGQEGRFPPPRLTARCRISQETFAGTRANGRDAPIPDLPTLTREREGSTRRGSSRQSFAPRMLLSGVAAIPRKIVRYAPSAFGYRVGCRHRLSR